MSAELVTWIAQCEVEDAFTDFYKSEHEQQVRRAFLLVGDEAVAHDVVAEAFTRVFRRWDDIDTPGPYLHQSVLNGCKDVHRRGRRGELTGDVESAAEKQSTAENEEGNVEAADELGRVLLALPFRQRAAIVLRYYGGQTEAEIAAALGCRPGTVGSLIHRGLAALRTSLEGEIS